MTKYTGWFPANITPTREGIYETKSPVLGNQAGWFSYWNGKSWSVAYLALDRALSARHWVSEAQNREWRGLAAAPLARCAAARDGECSHVQCPQIRDSEPIKSGRHCPLDTGEDEQ